MGIGTVLTCLFSSSRDFDGLEKRIPISIGIAEELFRSGSVRKHFRGEANVVPARPRISFVRGTDFFFSKVSFSQIGERRIKGVQVDVVRYMHKLRISLNGRVFESSLKECSRVSIFGVEVHRVSGTQFLHECTDSIFLALLKLLKEQVIVVREEGIRKNRNKLFITSARLNLVESGGGKGKAAHRAAHSQFSATLFWLHFLMSGNLGFDDYSQYAGNNVIELFRTYDANERTQMRR